MKLMKAWLAVLLLATGLSADVYTKGQLAVSLSAVATTGAGTAFAVPLQMDGQPSSHTYTVVTTGAPTSISVDLEGSLDGTNYFTLATISSADAAWKTTLPGGAQGEMMHVVQKGVRWLRCNITSYVPNGTTATCSFISSIR